MDIDQAISQIVYMEETDGEIRVQLTPPPAGSLTTFIYGNAFEVSALLLFRRAVRMGARRVDRYSVAYSRKSARDADALLASVGHRFEAIARRPIAQKRVEEVLDISHLECNRWTKDGPLPRSGSVAIGRAESMKVRQVQYSPRLIAKLADERIRAAVRSVRELRGGVLAGCGARGGVPDHARADLERQLHPHGRL